jgi:hypothetical protein
MALPEKSFTDFFSVQPLSSLCLGGSLLLIKDNHRDTENSEVAQRKHFSGKASLDLKSKSTFREWEAQQIVIFSILQGRTT